MGYEAMFKAYNDWIKTPKGQKMTKESKSWKLVEITELPDGWEHEDGSVENGYFTYYNSSLYMEIIIQQYWSQPCWAGGYPEGHYIGVWRKDEDDIEDGTEGILVKKFSIHKLGWDKAMEEANEFALGEMESLGY